MQRRKRRKRGDNIKDVDEHDDQGTASGRRCQRENSKDWPEASAGYNDVVLNTILRTITRAK